jgi:hypothetical protein
MTLLRKGDAALQWDQAWEFLEITVAHYYATSWNFQVTLQRRYIDTSNSMQARYEPFWGTSPHKAKLQYTL